MVLWTEEQRRFLGISEKEHSLLNSLHKIGHQNTRELAFNAKVARVTAIRLLRGLHKRGFVSKQTLRTEVRWYLTRPDLILKRFAGLFENVEGIKTASLPLSEIANVTVFKGPQEMFESNKKFLVAHAGERLYSIEPSGIWKHVNQIPAKDWVHLNSLLMQKKVVIETMVEEDAKAHMQRHIDPTYAQSFLDLSNEFHVLPKGFLNSSTEIVIFRDQAFFLDWEQLVGVEIKNPSTIKLLKGMFELLKRASIKK